MAKKNQKAKPVKAKPVSSNTATLKRNLTSLRKLKDMKKVHEAKIKELNGLIDPLVEKCFSMMTALDIQKITMNGNTFFTTARKFFSMTDKAEGTKWIKENAPELLSVNAQTLNSFLNEWIEKNKKKPPKIFREFTKESVQIRKLQGGE